MKKILFICTVLSIVATFCSIALGSVSKTKSDYNKEADNISSSWQENHFDVTITPYELEDDNCYHILYDGVDLEQIAPTDEILFLMVNGSIVPNAQIKIVDGNSYVNTNVLEKHLDVTVEYCSDNMMIDIVSGNTGIIMELNNNMAMINGKKIELVCSPSIINSELYIPLRIVAESMSAEVGWISDLAGISGYSFIQKSPLIHVVTVDTTGKKPTFTKEQGLAIVKAASVKAHDEVVNFLEQSKATFEERRPDYNPLSVNQINVDVGSYYVYILDNFEKYSIFVNKYTGEIFSRKTGTYAYKVSEDFINLRSLYQ